jgi:hypothetical protein
MSEETGLTKMTQPASKGLAPRMKEDDDGQQFLSIVIAQPAHPKKPDDLAPGQFFLPLTGEGIGDKIMAICVAQFFTRAYWRKQKEGEVPDVAPLCASLDGVKPEMNGGKSPAQPNGGGVVDNCSRCSFKDWRIDPATKNKLPPLCSRSINYIAIVRGKDNVDRIARLGFKRTSYRVGEEIEKVTRSALPARNLWDTVFELSLTEVKKPQQRYFVAKQRVIGMTSAKSKDMLAQAEKIFAEWSPVKAARVANEAFQEELHNEDGDAVEQAPAGAGPAAKGAPPDDDLPF